MSKYKDDLNNMRFEEVNFRIEQEQDNLYNAVDMEFQIKLHKKSNSSTLDIQGLLCSVNQILPTPLKCIEPPLKMETALSIPEYFLIQTYHISTNEHDEFGFKVLKK
jgi:hypothetical protein